MAMGRVSFGLGKISDQRPVAAHEGEPAVGVALVGIHVGQGESDFFGDIVNDDSSAGGLGPANLGAEVVIFGDHDVFEMDAIFSHMPGENLVFAEGHILVAQKKTAGALLSGVGQKFLVGDAAGRGEIKIQPGAKGAGGHADQQHRPDQADQADAAGPRRGQFLLGAKRPKTSSVAVSIPMGRE